jgi:hypothetical protein
MCSESHHKSISRTRCTRYYAAWLTGVPTFWQEFTSEANYYNKVMMPDSTSCISHVGTTAPPRILSPTKRCNCQKHVAFTCQCPHEICDNEGRLIVLSMWDTRWYHRIGTQKSLSCTSSPIGISTPTPPALAPADSLPRNEYTDHTLLIQPITADTPITMMLHEAMLVLLL